MWPRALHAACSVGMRRACWFSAFIFYRPLSRCYWTARASSRTRYCSSTPSFKSSSTTERWASFELCATLARILKSWHLWQYGSENIMSSLCFFVQFLCVIIFQRCVLFILFSVSGCTPKLLFEIKSPVISHSSWQACIWLKFYFVSSGDGAVNF